MEDLSGAKRALLAGFSGESMARTRYDIFAEIAEKEGYEKIAEVFRRTADNEKEHAKVMLKLLNALGNTGQNLRQAAMGAHAEWARLYKESAQIADEEGEREIRDFFIRLQSVEEGHEMRFLQYLNMIENRESFSGKEENWICRKCGYSLMGSSAPDACPLCGQPQSHFERLNK